MLGQTKDMTAGPPVRQILLFTAPLLVGNVFQQLYNMADMVIVGRTIDSNALAAIGATGAIAFMVVGVSFGLTSGFTVVTAQRFGAGDEAGVRRSVASCVVLGAAVTVFLTVFSVLTARPLFAVMQTPADIVDDAYSYIIVIYAGTCATVFFNLFGGILRALGDSVTPLIFLIVASIVNIALDYIFIVNFGMGVAGAGWATVVSQALSVLMCLVYSLRRFPVLRLRREDWRVDSEFLWQHLSIGVSMGTQMFIIAVSTIFIQVAVNRLGTDSVKAFSAAAKIDQLATQPLASLGVALATFAAQNFGARQMGRIREGAKKGSLLAVGMGALGCVFMLVAGKRVVGLFGIGENEAGVVREAAQYLNIVSCFYFLLGLLFVYRNILQGMGKNTMPMVSAGAEIAIRILATFTFTRWLGFLGVCLVNPLCWLGAVAMLLIGYFRAMRDARYDEHPGYESVVLRYEAQPKFGPVTGSAPPASVRIELDKPAGGDAKPAAGSVRFL